MPFTLDLCDDEPYEIRINQNAFEIIATVPIGHDAQAGSLYSVQVALIRLAPFDGPHKAELYRAELMFDIVDATAGGLRFIDNGLETKKILTGEHRKAALDVICSVTSVIVSQRQPDEIVMSTSQSSLPSKGLVKYRHVSNAILSVGYLGGEGDIFEGHSIWMFVKA